MHQYHHSIIDIDTWSVHTVHACCVIICNHYWTTIEKSVGCFTASLKEFQLNMSSV